MAGRNQPPKSGARPVVHLVENVPRVVAEEPLKLIHNPFNPSYILNGCPVHSSHFRWVTENTFQSMGDGTWLCEDCEEFYTDAEVKTVLERDEIKQNLDVIQWPIKYAWAGAYPHNGGFSYPCPKCGSDKTAYGTISNTTIPGLAKTMMRWYCTKCGTIFDMMDVPEYWSMNGLTPMEQAAVDVSWEEHLKLQKQFGEDESDD